MKATDDSWHVLSPADALRLLQDLAHQVRTAKDYESDKVVGLISGIIISLALHPEANELRVELYRFFEPEHLGTSGRALLVMTVMSLIENIKVDPNIPQTDTSEATDEGVGLAFDWIKSRAEELKVHNGQIAPDTILDPVEYKVPLENFFPCLERFMLALTDDVMAEGTNQAITMVAQISVLCRNQSKDGLVDLRLMRTAITVLASKGRNQDARNLVEQALQITDGDQHRMRHAWFIFADTYIRSNLITEALIGIACFLSIPIEVSPEQGFLEGFVGVRTLRDAGFADFASVFLTAADSALNLHIAGEKFRHRVGTMAIQLELKSLPKISEIKNNKIEELIAKAIENYKTVLKCEPDDLAPCCSNLVTLFNLAKSKGISIPQEIAASMKKNIQDLPSPQREILALAVSQTISAKSLCELVGKYQTSQYSRDNGFDLKMVKNMANSLMDTLDLKTQIEDFIYAVELLCDLRFTNKNSTLLSAPNLPFDMALKVSANNTPLFIAGLSQEFLTCAIFQNGRLIHYERTSVELFDPNFYYAWSQNYPYQYAYIDDPNEVFTSTDRMRFPRLPDNCTVITNISLQKLPPNLFRQDDTFLGLNTGVTLAPSLGWLSDLPKARKEKKKKFFWVAGESPKSTGIGGLPRIMNEVHPMLEAYDFETISNETLNQGIHDAACLVMVAHGGLSSDEQFFSIFAEENEEIIANTKSLSAAIAGVELVIALSCSAGRVDRHIDKNASVSFITELLTKGCRTVIAPAWPFEVRLTKLWLETFFASFYSGENASTSCFLANSKLAEENGRQPQLSINMNVFGDQKLTLS